MAWYEIVCLVMWVLVFFIIFCRVLYLSFNEYIYPWFVERKERKKKLNKLLYTFDCECSAVKQLNKRYDSLEERFYDLKNDIIIKDLNKKENEEVDNERQDELFYVTNESGRVVCSVRPKQKLIEIRKDKCSTYVEFDDDGMFTVKNGTCVKKK